MPKENFSVALTDFFLRTGDVVNTPYTTPLIHSVMNAPEKKKKNQGKESLADSMPTSVCHHSIHSLVRSSSLGREIKEMEPQETFFPVQNAKKERCQQSGEKPKEVLSTVECHTFLFDKPEHAIQGATSREKQTQMLTKGDSFFSQKTTQYFESDKTSQSARGSSGETCALPSTSSTSAFLSNINVPTYSSDLPTCRRNLYCHSGETTNLAFNITEPKSELLSRSLRGPTPPQRHDTPKERHRQLFLALSPKQKMRVPAIRRKQPKDLPRLIFPKEQKESLTHLSADTYWKIGCSSCSFQKKSKKTKSAKHRLPGIDRSSKLCALSVSPHFQRSLHSLRSGSLSPYKLYGNSHYSSRSHCFSRKREPCHFHPFPYENLPKRKQARLRVVHGKGNDANDVVSKKVFKGLSGAQVCAKSVTSFSLPFSSLRNSVKHPLGKLKKKDESGDIDRYPFDSKDKMTSLKSLSSAKYLKDFLSRNKDATSVYSYRMHLLNVYLNEDVKYTMGAIKKQST